MESGAELDALVAEKVMGWHLVDGWWVHLNGGLAGYHENDGLPAIGTEGDSDRWTPSDYIAHAWEVVEKLGTLTLSRGDIADISVWVAQFVTEEPGYPVNVQSVAKTAPYAICLAALKAIGAEVANEEILQ